MAKMAAQKVILKKTYISWYIMLYSSASTNYKSTLRTLRILKVSNSMLNCLTYKYEKRKYERTYECAKKQTLR